MPEPWTTPAQRTWLEERVPKWHEVRGCRGEKGAVQWLAATTTSFLEVFTLSQPDRVLLPSVSVSLHSHRSNGR